MAVAGLLLGEIIMASQRAKKTEPQIQTFGSGVILRLDRLLFAQRGTDEETNETVLRVAFDNQMQFIVRGEQMREIEEYFAEAARKTGA